MIFFVLIESCFRMFSRGWAISVQLKISKGPTRSQEYCDFSKNIIARVTYICMRDVRLS